MTDTILFGRIGHVARLVLNNPRRHNALGREQLEEIKVHLRAVAEDSGVRVLLLTGSGDKTFCAGASLQELSGEQIEGSTFQSMTSQLAALEVPIVCAMNGDVFGGGVELALSCDYRIGVEGSRMRVPAAAIGLCYPKEGIQRFLECLGPAITGRILVAAEEFDAEAMLKIGFLDHLVPRHALEDYANELAQHIAGLAPLAVKSMKRLIRQAASFQVDAELASELSKLCLESEDFQEGLAAKREKREPRFRGR